MDSIEIWWSDLNEEKQKELMEAMEIDEVHENFYITTIDI